MDFQLSSLPWFMAIEALGCSNLVEPSLLQDLLKKAPPGSYNMGNASEWIALKHLECLLASSSATKLRFDPSHSCQQVLRQIISEISPYEQRISGPELSKWDLESFIKHKKSNLPKCTLEQLKDGTVAGRLSICASLKEKSCLPVGIHVENQAPAKDGNCSTRIAGGSDKYDGIHMPSELPNENLAPVNRKRKAGESPSEQLYTICMDPSKKNKYDTVCNEQDVGLENRGKGLCELIPTNKDIDKRVQNVPKTVETVGEAEDGTGISSNDDASHDERTALDKKKKTFLSSQCTDSQDDLATTCMKCKKGGNLLSCTSDSCPIVIHESCLDSNKSFDAKENFYCPFCAYSRALSKFEEVKKYASLIRMDFTTFFCSGPKYELEKQFCRSSMMDGNGLKQKDALPETNELINVVEKVSNHHHRKKLECEQAGPSELHSDHCPPFGRRTAASTDTIDQSLERDKQEAKGIQQESRATSGSDQKPIAAEVVHNPHIEYKFCEVSETSGREKHADVRSEKGVTHPPGTGSQNSQSTDAEQISEEEDEDEDSGTSKYFISVRIQERKSLYPAKDQSRKKRLLWTSKEEEKLKKGVKKYCCPHSSVIPWKKILIFGEGVFDPSRTAMDLKGKWRNMCKASKSN